MERCNEWGNKSNKEVWHMRTMITQIIEKKNSSGCEIYFVKWTSKESMGYVIKGDESKVLKLKKPSMD